MEEYSKKAAIVGMEYYLPGTVVTNDDLAAEWPDWSVEKIFSKTGIAERHIASQDETASDLGYEAAKKLMSSKNIDPEEIDLLLYCTQTPDYALPSTACILQDRLGISTRCAAFDYNLGCSGFVYGLSIAKAFLENGLAKKSLLITADTYSKWLADDDRSVRTIFGDGAAATLLELVNSPTKEDFIGPFVFGTDGKGWHRLVVHQSGARHFPPAHHELLPEGHNPEHLFMDGANIFTFTLQSVPAAYQALLKKANLETSDLDMVVFHQANAFILEHLRKRIDIPKEKFFLALENFGNTVSSSIPITLKECQKANQLGNGDLIAIVGFGVGYSWSAALIRWQI